MNFRRINSIIVSFFSESTTELNIADLDLICSLASFYMDGLCDDENNVPDCNWDGGDCCGDVIDTFCVACECLNLAAGKLHGVQCLPKKGTQFTP